MALWKFHFKNRTGSRSCCRLSVVVGAVLTSQNTTVKRWEPWLISALKLFAAKNRILVLAAVFVLRFFKVLLYIRYLIEWLPQINPYLQPYYTIYRATDGYTALLQSLVPPIFGIDIAGFVSWFILDFVEGTLCSVPGVAEAVR